MRAALPRLAVAALGILAACGDGASRAASTPSTAPATAPATVSSSQQESAPTSSGDTASTSSVATGQVEVQARDFTFVGVPAHVAVGTSLSFSNTSTTEVHEMVVARLRDGETRSAATIMALPDAEMAAAFDDAPPVMVFVSGPQPGGSPLLAAGDATLTRPGRYVVLCSIPSGITPADYFATVATAPPGPLVIAGHAPHYTLGMFAETDVG